jgi:Alginate lyase
VKRMLPNAKSPAIGLDGTSRRAFCCGTASLLLARSTLLGGSAFGQAPPTIPATPTRPDVAAIDHDRILAAAQRYLTQSPTPLTSVQCERSPGTVHDYYSEAAPTSESGAASRALPPPFTGHRDALFQLGLAVPALAGAHLLTGEERYAEHAALHLRAWFIDPATRMTPSLNYGQAVPVLGETHATIQNNTTFGAPSSTPSTGHYQGILETLPLVEIAQAIPFLAASSALSEADLAALHAWFAAYLTWLTAPEDRGPRLPALARDQKDHHATSWLLQTSAYACLALPQGDAARSEDSMLAQLRHRFKTVTLRAQMSPTGTFPHELGSATPYRDSLFNLDMMAGICQLLSTRFESVWDYQLEDGPGMRSAIAYHFAYIVDRATWPFRADSQHFDLLPARRASLLLAARAYQRPEYATLWKALPPDPAQPDILRTLPIHQPLLWVRQPPRPA